MTDDDNMHPFQYGPDPFPVNKPLQRYGNTMKSLYCLPCHTRFGVMRFHRHHSTQHFHTTIARTSTDVNCPTCKHTHPIQPQEGYRIVLVTSSTLHNVFLDPQMRSPIHYDVESIPGARLQELYQSWLKVYNNSFPQHVVVVGGLNDVANTSMANIQATLKRWSINVRSLNNANTFRVCKLLKPPMLAWLPGNGPPPPGFVNHLERIEEINQYICDLNASNGHFSVIGFGSEGIRKSRKRGADGRQLLMHKFSSWREQSRGPEHCLHLNDNCRTIMMKKLLRYLIANV